MPNECLCMADPIVPLSPEDKIAAQAARIAELETLVQTQALRLGALEAIIQTYETIGDILDFVGMKDAVPPG